MHEILEQTGKYAQKELLRLWFRLYNSQVLYYDKLSAKYYADDQDLYNQTSDICNTIEAKRKELLKDPLWEEFGSVPDLMDYNMF